MQPVATAATNQAAMEGGRTSERRGTVPVTTLVALALAAAGVILSVFAYGSLVPTLTAAVVFGIVLAALLLTPLGGSFERRMFVMAFAVCWLMSGVAAVYAEKFDDRSQLKSDASTFYELSAAPVRAVSVDDLRVLTEGAGAVVAWRKVYAFARLLGLDPKRHIGILVNILAVSLAGVLVVKAGRVLYGEDPARLSILVLLFCTCGLYWLFASVHLRDGVILLGIAALLLAWIRYLVLRRTRDIIVLALASAFGLLFFGLLRTEFAFVPLAMLLAGLIALMLFDRGHGARRLFFFATAIIGLAILMVLAASKLEEITAQISRGLELYSELSSQSSDKDSLGVRYVTSAAVPIRVLLGSVYLFVFPVPFWAGFQLESVYNLFKSCNVLFFYVFTPLLIYAAWRLLRRADGRSAATMFLLVVSAGFTMAVAGTSLETRHFGVFTPAMLLLAASVPLRDPRTAQKVRSLTGLYVAAIVLLHVAWALVKWS